MSDYQPAPTYADVILIDDKPGADGKPPKPTFNPIWLNWFLGIVGVLNAAGGTAIDHNSLSGLQGGTANQYYHLTAAEHAALGSLGALGNNRVLYSNGSGVLTTEAAFGYDQTTNTLTADNVSVADTLTIGSAAADTLVVNSGVWTLNSNIAATRAAGTIAAGAVDILLQTVTFTGDAGGTSVGRLSRIVGTVQGANAVSGANLSQYNLEHAGSATLGNGRTLFAGITLSSAANITTALGADVTLAVTGAGTIVAGIGYRLTAPVFTSTGSITTLTGFTAANLGHATLVGSAIGFNADNMTVSPTLTVSFRSQQNSGSNAWGFLHTGTANNAFTGNVRIGSSVAPTAALDVTGAAIISSTLDVTGNTTLNANVTIGDASGDTLTLNAGAWTLNSNRTLTRAIGTLAAGSTSITSNVVTVTEADAGGTSSPTVQNFSQTFAGGNAYNTIRVVNATITYTATANATTALAFDFGSLHSGSGNITTTRIYSATVRLTGSGSSATGQGFYMETPTLSSTGAFMNLIGFICQNIGHATLVTNAIGFDCNDLTASISSSIGFRSRVTSGTGKWGFQASGNANNAFAGNVRIGSTVAPTVALDVTGAGLVSSTLGVTGVVSALSTLELGHATDTTLSRVAAGRIAVEGVGVVRGPATATDTAVAKYNGTNGDLIQDSTILINSSNVMIFPVDRGVRFNNQTSAAAAAVGTLNNAPVAGDPGFWLKINIGGTNYALPAWAG